MNSEQFTFWLLGYFEIAGVSNLTKKEAETIYNRLKEVYVEVPKLPELPDIFKKQ